MFRVSFVADMQFVFNVFSSPLQGGGRVIQRNATLVGGSAIVPSHALKNV